MADPRFFERAGPFTLGEMAERCGARLAAGDMAGRSVDDVATLDQAGPGQLTFLDNPKYAEAFARTQAGACILHEKHVALAPAGMALLLSPKPYLTYARAAQMFYPAPKAIPGIHPTAVVDASVTLGEGVAVAAHAVIEAGAEIGAGTSEIRRMLIGRELFAETC